MSILNSTLSIYESVYIISFGIGLLTSVAGLFGGSHLHVGHAHVGGIQAHSGGIGTHAGHPTPHPAAKGIESVPLFNIQSLFAFLVGFGAFGLVGYIIFKPAIVSIIPAVIGGWVFWVLISKLLGVMIKNQTGFLHTSFEDAIGANGTVVSKIFPGAIGEVMYFLEGSNRIIRAQSLNDEGIEKGKSVVIMKVNDGIAIVTYQERFEELSKIK